VPFLVLPLEAEGTVSHLTNLFWFQVTSQEVNRKDYGMNKGIPFIKIANHMDVNIHLKWKHVGGPPLA